MSSMEKGETDELLLILKGDGSGSVEALEDALAQIDVGDEVALRVIDRGVGAITETNVMLAAASNAVIIGFNVRPQGKATELADREGVEIKYYSIIYNAIEEIEAALKGLLKPEFEEAQLGTAEIRDIFRSSKIGNIAGCMVTGGTIKRNAKARLLRDGAVVADNLDSRQPAPREGRRVRGPRRLRVRSRAQGLQRHQGRRHHRDVRDARKGSRDLNTPDVRACRRNLRQAQGALHFHEENIMAGPRNAKVGDRIKVVVAQMLERRVKDPRLGFVTITDVRMTGDGQQASVFYTVMGDEKQRDDTAAALQSATGIIRSEVGKQLGTRHHAVDRVLPRLGPRDGQGDRGPARQGQGIRRRGRRAAPPAPSTPATPIRTRSRCRRGRRGRRSDRAAVRSGHRRQAVRLDVSRRRRPDAPARRHPQGRPCRHARPDGHGRPGARHQPRDPAAGPPDATPTRSTSPRSGSASPP